MQTLASRTGDEPAPRWQPVCAAIAPLPTIDPPPSELRIALPDGGQARLPGALWPAARSSVPPRSGPPATSPIAVGEVARADVNALYEARGGGSARRRIVADGTTARASASSCTAHSGRRRSIVTTQPSPSIARRVAVGERAGV